MYCGAFFVMRVYTHSVKVLEEHVDELQHVNNVVYVQFLQEAAIAHWYMVAPKTTAQNVRWVVRKHEIEYLKPARIGENLVVKTWIVDFDGLHSKRAYEIFRDGDLLVKAFTHWICLDANTLRPKRIPLHELNSFF